MSCAGAHLSPAQRGLSLCWSSATHAPTSTCHSVPQHQDVWLGNNSSSQCPPAAGMCLGTFPSSKTQPPKLSLSWSSNVQRRAGVPGEAHISHATLCSTRKPLGLKRRGPSWVNPSQLPHPSTARALQGAKPSPEVRGQGRFGAGCPEAELTAVFPQTGWFHAAGGFPAGAQPKPTHSLWSRSQTGLYSSHSPRAERKSAQAQRTCSSYPPQSPTSCVPLVLETPITVPELWWGSPVGTARLTLLKKAAAPVVLGLARPPFPSPHGTCCQWGSWGAVVWGMGWLCWHSLGYGGECFSWFLPHGWLAWHWFSSVRWFPAPNSQAAPRRAS